MPIRFHLFGAAHLSILAAVVTGAAILTALQRRLGKEASWLRVGVGTALLLDSALWYAWQARLERPLFPAQLPLELCDATLLLVAIVLLTLHPLLFDVGYYAALGGTTMALVTPDLWEQFPSPATVQFFVAHGLVVASVLYLVGSGLARPRPWSVARAMAAINIYAVVVGAFDWKFGTNYMYLAAKPQNASLLDLLGPWPCYIAAAEAVALVLFTLLWLPWRLRRPTDRKTSL
jgi:hypothetical integral membrane protein (TIGR02206 family)